jgi:hypothetical protein
MGEDTTKGLREKSGETPATAAPRVSEFFFTSQEREFQIWRAMENG